jgi:hypothetical protein
LIKRKRKEKPQSGSNRKWLKLGLTIAILLLSLVVLFVYTHIFSLDGQLCHFDSNPNIFIDSHESKYITNVTNEFRIDLPREFSSPRWQLNSPYVWSTGEKISFLNLDTHSLHFFEKPDWDSIQFGYSPTRQYLMLKTNNSGLSDIIILDGLSDSILSEFQTKNLHHLWTPDERIILFYSQNVVDAEIFDVATLTLSSVILPSDMQSVMKWIDNNKLVYVTPAGRYRMWNRDTGETDNFTDFRVEARYVAGGQEFVNSRGRWQWIGGIDTNNNFQLLNLESGDQITFPVDLSEPFFYIIYPHYILFDYTNSETRKLKVYHVATRQLATFTFPLSEPPRLSDNGKYLVYDLGDNRTHKYVIQDVISGLDISLAQNLVRDVEWVEIDDVTYLLYVMLDEEGYTSNLFRPDTQEQCVIGELGTTKISIQQ